MGNMQKKFYSVIGWRHHHYGPMLLATIVCLYSCKAAISAKAVANKDKDPGVVTAPPPSVAATPGAPSIKQIQMADIAGDLFLNMAEVTDSPTISLIMAPELPNETRAEYSLTSSSTECDASIVYSERIPTVGDLAGLDDGEYHVCIKLSGSGSDTFHSSPVFTLDRKPPPAPNTPKDAGLFVSGSTINFTWTTSSSASADPTTYELKIASSNISNPAASTEVGVYKTPDSFFNFTAGDHDNTYVAAVRAFDTAGNASEWSPLSDGVRVDATAPTVGLPVRFQEMFDTILQNTGLADIGWTAAPSDPESGILKQSILVYANNSDCTGSPNLTIDTTANANSHVWPRLNGGLQGELRFRVLAENTAGIAASSPCSGVISYRNTALAYTRQLNSFGAGQSVNADSIVDIDGDGIKDIVVVNRVWSNGRGGLMIIRGGPNIHTQPLLFYEGEQDLAYLSAKIADVTGDGIADVILNAYDFTDGATTQAGVLYVFKGGPDLPASAPIATVAHRRWTGASASAQICSTRLYVYDATGDGVQDIFCSNAFANSNTGTAAFIIGGPSMVANGTLETKADRVYTGTISGDRFGPVTANCSDFADVYGDSRKDLIISNTYFHGGKGAIFVITTGLPLPASGLAEASLTNFQGEGAGDKVGGYAECADVTGDSKADILAAETTTTVSGKLNTGSIYVIESATTPPTGGMVSTAAKRYDGDLADDRFGTKMRAVDGDGDGIADIFSANLSANPGGRAAAGSLFYIKGGSTLPGSGSVGSLGSSSRRYDGTTAGDYIDFSLSPVAQVAGTAVPELILIQSNASPGGRAAAGLIHIVPGQYPLPASGTIASLSPVTLEGELAGDTLGAITIAKKLNDDAYDDLIVLSHAARPQGMTEAGSIFVIPGGASLPSAGLVTSSGYRYDGEFPYDRVGNIFATANIFIQNIDVNGDGHFDLITSYSGASPGGDAQAGSYYILKGGSFNPSGPISTAGIRIDGDLPADFVGCNYCLFIDDLNGDGISDMIFKTTSTTVSGNPNAGSVWAVPGKTGLTSTKAGTAGLRIDGPVAGAKLGSQLAFYDINTDGFTDLLISNAYDSPRSQIIGVFGRAASISTPLTPVTIADQISGDPPFIGIGIIAADVTGDGKPELVNGGYYWSGAIADLLGHTDNGGIFIIPNAMIPK